VTEQTWVGDQRSELISSDLVRAIREQAGESSLPVPPAPLIRPPRASPPTPRQAEARPSPDLAPEEDLDWTGDPDMALAAVPALGRTERVRMQRALTLVFVSLFAYLVLAAPVAAALLPAERWARVEPTLADIRQVVTSLVLLIVGFFFGKRSE